MKKVDINYGHLEYIKEIWYMLWPFGNLVEIWYIFSWFGILTKEKSGNPNLANSIIFLQLYAGVQKLVGT
jgi:hypothetical protein